MGNGTMTARREWIPRQAPASSVLTAPRGLMSLRGALVPRRMGLVKPGEPLKCRRDHVIDKRGEIFDGVGAFACGAFGGCDCAVLVIEGSSAASVHVDLTVDELMELRRLRWTSGQIFDYLGVTLPGAGLDAGGAAT